MSRAPGDLIVKDPDATDDPQGFDWGEESPWLAELGAGVTIVSSVWTVSPTTVPPLALSAPSIVTGSLRTQVKLSGGLEGTRYTVTNHVTTSLGNTDDRSFLVLVQQR